jgi:hypothetical protein
VATHRILLGQGSRPDLAVQPQAGCPKEIIANLEMGRVIMNLSPKHTEHGPWWVGMLAILAGIIYLGLAILILVRWL